ncbi:UNVERIFIED_CONTAM: Retrovirus-related Pol polyprotein from transposon RE1 [Sesamum latifolium]|uniref:Retrovirus-related Pol polyprotein from transposon RE1 n=1 Tax=Sesamum latifolium TaxID=2727402 RepID=A0AAW2X2R6_9LAMI
MVMILAPLNENNWLSWNRSVWIALEGRDKLGYIDGTCAQPVDGSAYLKQWRIMDSMVRTWILNTISKYIVNAYLYASSARSLWLDLEARYGECDGPLLYKIHRQIGSMTQGKGYENRGVLGHINNMHRKGPMDKRNLICEHCHKTGHSKKTCFRLHGVPDWYKELGDQKKRNGNGSRAYVSSDNNSADLPTAAAVTTGGDLVADLMEALKIIQNNKIPQDPVRVHFAQGDEMASMANETMDLTTKHVLAIGRQVGKLYYFDKSSFISVFAFAPKCNNSLVASLSASDSLYTLLHKHLGHTSSIALSHIMLNSVANKDNRGPYKQPSMSGFHYVLTIVDDHTRGQKCYKVFDIDNKVAFVSRDVKFHEHVFPYLTTHSSSVSDSVVIPNPISDTVLIHPTLNSTPYVPVQESSPPPVPDTTSRPHRQIRPLVWLKDFHCHSSFDHSCNLASSHNNFMASLSTVQEPNHYLQAKGKTEREHAMQEELTALNKNETWEVVDLPEGKKAIGSKWVFKLKLKPDGTVDRYKARLVAKGYNQVEGEDYIKWFSPVAKAVIMRILLAVASSCAWPIHQVNINNAFFHGFLDEDIYMLPPDGAPIPTRKLCILILLVNVDDILLTGPSEAEITEVKCFLDSEFTIKDVGHAKYFLGLEITRCAAVSTPLPLSVKLSDHDGDPLPDPGPYRRLVGHLLYLSFTRPDISFGAQQLSQFVHQPSQAHMDAAPHLVRYLKGNPDQGLFFPVSNSSTLTAFCDADWAGCTDLRRSLSGYCIFLGDALISWKSKKQPTVARSTAKAEYWSLGTAAAIHIVANPIFHERTKHIEIDCHLIHDHYKSGFILPSYVPSKSQLADVFTKSLPASLFHSFVSKLGLISPSQVQLEGGLLNMNTSTSSSESSVTRMQPTELEPSPP